MSDAIAAVMQKARTEPVPKTRAPKCRYCNAQPMRVYLWTQILRAPGGNEVQVMLACCDSCNRELETTVLFPQPAALGEKRTAGGLFIP